MPRLDAEPPLRDRDEPPLDPDDPLRERDDLEPRDALPLDLPEPDRDDLEPADDFFAADPFFAAVFLADDEAPALLEEDFLAAVLPEDAPVERLRADDDDFFTADLRDELDFFVADFFVGIPCSSCNVARRQSTRDTSQNA